jgi:hypothetical protein
VLPLDIAFILGAGDGEVGETIFTRLFAGGRYNPELARILAPEVVRDVGQGSISAGRKVLQRFIDNIRAQHADTKQALVPRAEGGGIGDEHVGPFIPHSPPLQPDVLQGQIDRAFRCWYAWPVRNAAGRAERDRGIAGSETLPESNL